MTLFSAPHPGAATVAAVRAAAGLPIALAELRIRVTGVPRFGAAAATVGTTRAFWVGEDAADGTFALRLAEGSDAISVERTETGNGAFRWRGADAAGATVRPPSRCFLAAEDAEDEAEGEAADRLAVVRDLVEGADFAVGPDAEPASAADTELSPVSASATPVAGP